ncbi:circularly permuted type 2 ATP-grasp protein, partial [Klebsiella pneumoniae]|uniref:circularly permuted type 2 ATP-grasp protein n=1 Tax=Klebsiella pneumoniae TaxID=573 RepID=UPI003EE0A1B5
GGDQLDRRWEQVRQLIRENGVTFNVYGAEDGMDRLWQLDPFPMIVHASEWSRISAGLQQRARLLELLMEDVYGSQVSLTEGWLPPDL